MHADDPFELANVRATPAGTAFAAANAPLTQFLSSCKGDECNRPVPVPATRFACYNVTPPSFPRTRRWVIERQIGMRLEAVQAPRTVRVLRADGL